MDFDYILNGTRKNKKAKPKDKDPLRDLFGIKTVPVKVYKKDEGGGDEES